MPNIRPIRTEDDYEAAVAQLSELWGAELGTEDGDLLDVLMVLVSDYEKEHHDLGLPDPIEAIKIRMEETGTTRERLGEILGAHSGRVSEILNRRRPLTLKMIRILSEALTIPIETLAQDYPLAREGHVPAGQGIFEVRVCVGGEPLDAEPAGPKWYPFKPGLGSEAVLLGRPQYSSFSHPKIGKVSPWEPLRPTAITGSSDRSPPQKKAG